MLTIVLSSCVSLGSQNCVFVTYKVYNFEEINHSGKAFKNEFTKITTASSIIQIISPDTTALLTIVKPFKYSFDGSSSGFVKDSGGQFYFVAIKPDRWITIQKAEDTVAKRRDYLWFDRIKTVECL